MCLLRNLSEFDLGQPRDPDGIFWKEVRVGVKGTVEADLP